ncbi:MAG: acyltransferase domain-containing protein, partial [bacterium]|nr:acyltransferase domain-containing protein [bacterium]
MVGKQQLLAISGESREALIGVARAYLLLLAQEDAPQPGDACAHAVASDAYHPYRLAAVACSRSGLAKRLDAFLRRTPCAGLWVGNPAAGTQRRRLAFVFPGQGSQWHGMGRELLAQESVFRRSIEASDGSIRRHGGWSLREELTAGPEHSRLEEIDVTQPTILAYQVALAALWRSWGVEPAAVVGHSIGEMAASHVAGALRLEDVVYLVCCQDQLLRSTRFEGAMAVVGLSEAAARAALGRHEKQVSIAVINSPVSTVLSGDPAALGEILRELEGRGVFCRWIKSEVAGHSYQMAPLCPELKRRLEGPLKPRATRCPFYSTVTGRVLPGDRLDAAYWAANLGQTVLFSRAIRQLVQDGFDTFLEISPHPSVLASIRQCLQDLGCDGALLASVDRNEGERGTLLSSLGELYVLGFPIDLRQLYPVPRAIQLPAGLSSAGEPLPRSAPATGSPEQEEESRLLAFLRRQVGELIGVAPHSLAPDQRLSAAVLTSLQAVELKSKLERSLGFGPSLVTLFRGPTLEELAAELSGSPVPAAAPVRVELPDSGEFPLSRGQEALWFLCQLAPESSAYNVAFTFWLRSALDPSALHRALDALAERHPALRTTFHAPNGRPRQRLHARLDVDLSIVDATAASAAELQERLHSEVTRGFQLEEGPAIRVAIFSRSPRPSVLLLAMHHIVTDFWSMEILMRELGLLYAEQAGGPAAGLEPLPLRYSDYVDWQREWLAGAESERQWCYWRRRLGSALPPLALATDRRRPAVQTYRGSTQPCDLGRELSGRLRALVREHGTSLHTTFLAAFQALLGRYTGQEELLVGSVTSGRSAPGLADLVGYFVNPVALSADLREDPIFADFLARSRELMIEALEHQDFPFSLLVERLQPEREPSRPPLVQVMFVHQQSRGRVVAEKSLLASALNLDGVPIRLGGLDLESMRVEEGVSQFDLTLMTGELEGTFQASLQYNPEIFDRTTIRRMLGHFRTLLEAVVANPRSRLSNLAILTPPEHHQLLPEAPASTGLRAEITLQELFEAQVEQRPEAVALVFGERTISYRELDRRANRLANHLRSLGVGPEVLVGLCVERNTELVVGALGILKAGGSYVPFDPTHPKDRLELTLEDSQVTILLT